MQDGVFEIAKWLRESQTENRPIHSSNLKNGQKFRDPSETFVAAEMTARNVMNRRYRRRAEHPSATRGFHRSEDSAGIPHKWLPVKHDVEDDIRVDKRGQECFFSRWSM